MSEQQACHVCGDPADESNSAACSSCNHAFHLRLRNDAEGLDCGEVWINDQYLSLEYACNSCLGRGHAGPSEPSVGSRH